jgi:hypothetical protein
MITIERLDDLVDKRDKLTSKLFMKKLQNLITNGGENNNNGASSNTNLLNRCIYCGRLYTSD